AGCPTVLAATVRSADCAWKGPYRSPEPSVSYYFVAKDADSPIEAQRRGNERLGGNPRGDNPPRQFGFAPPPDRFVSQPLGRCDRCRALLVLVAGARACPGGASACSRSGAGKRCRRDATGPAGLRDGSWYGAGIANHSDSQPNRRQIAGSVVHR